MESMQWLGQSDVCKPVCCVATVDVDKTHVCITSWVILAISPLRWCNMKGDMANITQEVTLSTRCYQYCAGNIFYLMASHARNNYLYGSILLHHASIIWLNAVHPWLMQCYQASIWLGIMHWYGSMLCILHQYGLNNLHHASISQYCGIRHQIFGVRV